MIKSTRKMSRGGGGVVHWYGWLILGWDFPPHPHGLFSKSGNQCQTIKIGEQASDGGFLSMSLVAASGKRIHKIKGRKGSYSLATVREGGLGKGAQTEGCSMIEG